MINILLNASISGGIVVLLWYLLYPLSKKYFKASWHYIILKITLLFLILPLSIFAPELSVKPERLNINTETINSAVSNIIFPDEVSYTKNANPDFPYLQILWLIAAVIMFSGELYKMRRFKKQILNTSNSNVDRDTLDLFLQCREQLKVRGKVQLRTSEYIKTPLAFGLVNPIVILPQTDMNANEKRLAFIHELTHIKNGDLWLKFSASVISSVHWFNPLVHLLRRKISAVSEEYCDECVAGKMPKDERLLYGNLILKVVSDISMPDFCSTLSASTKNIQRRLFKMINLKKTHKGIIVLSIIAAVIMCSLATVYAFSANENEDYSYDIPEDVAPDSTETANADVSEQVIKVLTYEEYLAWLEEFKIESSDRTFTLTNGNGEESIVTAYEVYEAWASISDQVKDGTTQFKQIIRDGVVVAWGDFEYIG